MRRYAVIGWGSLIWDLEILAPHVEGPWRMGEGPRLPMEFARVSPKRKMGLAVCLDAVDGVPCRTHAIASRRGSVWRALIDLARRERASPRRIGAVCRATGVRLGSSREIVGRVEEWCGEAGWTGAVWTDLPANFAEMRGEPFSLVAAAEYLRGLRGESLDEAVRYIENAPEDTDTPLRRLLAGEDWWRHEAARLRGSGSAIAERAAGAGKAPG